MKTLIKYNHTKLLSLALSGLFMFLTMPSTAQGDLLIFPKRVVFEGVRKRSEIVNLSNKGKDTARYDISFVQIRMTEEGEFENITEPDPGQLFADPYLRHFPRRVVLAPNESQVVKIQLTRTSELAPGEYRSHVYFRSVPEVKPLGEADTNGEEKSTSLSIRLTPIYGITIPCIIRVGESTTRMSLSNLSFKMTNGQPVLSMDFNRSGNMSTYGDIVITHIAQNGRKTKVGEVKGFAVYTPGNLRRTRIVLKKAEGVDYGDGKLSVVYSTREATSKKTLAEAELTLF